MNRSSIVALCVAGLGVLYLSQNAAATVSDGGAGWDPFMTKLTASQVAQYASAAGFQGDDLVTAVAVALAESGGDPTAYNPETAAGAPLGEGSVGLWQIYLHAHPEYMGVNLEDPANNAAAAFAIYRAAGGFGPWSTFTSKSYLAQLEWATEGVQSA